MITEDMRKALRDMQAPTHTPVPRSTILSGSSRDYLEGNVADALSSLRSAFDCVEATEPHARDYAGEALESMTLAHLRRLARLKSIIAELDLLSQAYDAEPRR